MAFFSGWFGSNDNDNEIIEEEEFSTEEKNEIIDAFNATIDELDEAIPTLNSKISEKNALAEDYYEAPTKAKEASLRNLNQEIYSLKNKISEIESKKKIYRKQIDSWKR